MAKHNAQSQLTLERLRLALLRLSKVSKIVMKTDLKSDQLDRTVLL